MAGRESQPLLATDGAATGDVAFKAYGARWLMLALFCSVTFTNAYLWICFAPISTMAGEFLGVGSTAVNMLSLSFMILCECNG